VKIGLTGQVRIEHGDAVLDEAGLPGRQGRLVLALLALAGGPVHRDVLADALWPGGPPATWERTLSGVISRLRAAFATAHFEDTSIANAFGCYELQLPAGAEIDVRRAAARTDEGERLVAIGDHAAARDAAEDALLVARRPLLAGEEARWLTAERDELRALRVRALDVLAAAALGAATAIDAATEAIDTDPFRESSHALLMRAHAALGNTAEALLAYERCRELLAEELGIDPSPETKALHVALLQADDKASIDWLGDERPVTLPRTTTSFVGRQEQLASLVELMVRQRLVTLTGPGGVGKTRLAIEAARHVLNAFVGGVRFIDLTTVESSGALAEQVAVGLGLSFPSGATATLIAQAVGGTRVLAVMDSCEHIASACGKFLDELLSASSSLHVVATSRTPLGANVERVWAVDVLDVPVAETADGEIVGSESVELFCARAQRVRPDFEPSPVSMRAIGSICRRLDGLPLAIEIAAARVGSLSIAEIDEELDNRFAFPAETGALARHRTLRTAIDFSYDLLGRREARALRRCSVFEAGFSSSDASAICGDDVQESVDALARASLLNLDSEADPPRYRMLETIRAYARECARGTADWDDAVDNHIEHHATVVPELGRLRDFAESERRMALIEADATAAIERGLDLGRIGGAVSIAGSLWFLWLARGPFVTARSVLERTLAAARAAGHRDGAFELLEALGTIADNQSDFAGAERYFRDALEDAMARADDRSVAVTLVNLAGCVGLAGRAEEEEQLLHRAVEAAERSGSEFAAARAYMILGHKAGVRGDIEEARASLERALELFTALSHPVGKIRVSTELMLLGWPDHRPDDWRERFERTIELCRESGDDNSEAMVAMHAGLALAELGEFADAIAHLTRSLVLHRRLGKVQSALNCIEQIACVAAEIGDPAEALSLFAATTSVRAATGIPPSYPNEARLVTLRDRAESRAGTAAETAHRVGAQMPYEEAADRAETLAAALVSR
jgi:predicted ATPase/DNA-binding SARP family transcriptional activator